MVLGRTEIGQIWPSTTSSFDAADDGRRPNYLLSDEADRHLAPALMEEIHLPTGRRSICEAAREGWRQS
jgi:hypothetical protein